jgi:hypothetical protein
VCLELFVEARHVLLPLLTPAFLFGHFSTQDLENFCTII